VRGYDSKERATLTVAVLDLEKAGVELVLGDHGFAGIEECDLVVLSPGLKVHHRPLCDVIAAAEARGAEVIGELELAARFCPCPMICVTGTKGKSTTVKLIAEMLQSCGLDAIAAGNTGTPLISVLPDLAVKSWAVVEVSSFQLEKAPTLRPRIAVLLSLLEDHQDYHPTLEQYWETKLRLFAHQGLGDTAIFNGDDPRVRAYLGAVSPGAQTVIEVSGKNRMTNTPAPPGATAIAGAWWKDDMLKVFEHELLPWDEIPLRGDHNRANVAAALQAVLCSGLGELIREQPNSARFFLHQVGGALRKFASLPHRLELVAVEDDEVSWVNDSQSTIPDAAIAALNAFPAPVTLIAGGRSKLENEDAYDSLARAVASKEARLVLIGEAAGRLAEAARKIGVPESKIFLAETLPQAVQIAKMEASPGETVVLSPACASFDQFSSYEERGAVFRFAVHAAYHRPGPEES